MIDKKDQALIEQAKAKKAQNRDYFPSLLELRAIDKFLIDEEKKKNLAPVAGPNSADGVRFGVTPPGGGRRLS